MTTVSFVVDAGRFATDGSVEAVTGKAAFTPSRRLSRDGSVVLPEPVTFDVGATAVLDVNDDDWYWGVALRTSVGSDSWAFLTSEGDLATLSDYTEVDPKTFTPSPPAPGWAVQLNGERQVREDADAALDQRVNDVETSKVPTSRTVAGLSLDQNRTASELVAAMDAPLSAKNAADIAAFWTPVNNGDGTLTIPAGLAVNNGDGTLTIGA